MKTDSISRCASAMRGTLYVVSSATFIAILPMKTMAATEPGDGLRVIAAAQSLGLDAETLACLDVHNDEPALMLDRLNADFATYQQIQSLQDRILDHQQALHQANAVLRDFSENTEARLALDEAQAQIVLLSNQARTARTQLISTVLDELADTSMIGEVLEAEGQLVALPPHYRLAVDTAREAKELAWALQMQERSDADGSDMNPNAQQILQSAHAQGDVQLGKVRVETYGQANKSAMDQWVLMN